MLPLTPLRGILVLGMTNYDGAWWVPGLRKDRVKTLFYFPGYRGFGLNVISLRRPRVWWYRYKERAMRLLRDAYDMKLELIDDSAATVGTYPLGEQNWIDPPGQGQVMMISAYSRIDGGYVGDPETALMLLRRGIAPQRRMPNSSTCSIGFNERDQKWFGWSHRAMYGFGIGSVVDSEDHCCASSGWCDDYLAENPELDTRLPVGFTAKNLDDAKRMAIAFAESVG